jgi:glycosyltransferase involved in cell wall biosynthesis
MPNILIEAMSAGLPIACSQSQPMPEFLSSSGVYFDEEDINSISNSIEKLILDTNSRKNLSDSVRILSENYSWIKCANETFSFIKYNFNNACK